MRAKKNTPAKRRRPWKFARRRRRPAAAVANGSNTSISATYIRLITTSAEKFTADNAMYISCNAPVVFGPSADVIQGTRCLTSSPSTEVLSGCQTAESVYIASVSVTICGAQTSTTQFKIFKNKVPPSFYVGGGNAGISASEVTALATGITDKSVAIYTGPKSVGAYAGPKFKFSTDFLFTCSSTMFAPTNTTNRSLACQNGIVIQRIAGTGADKEVFTFRIQYNIKKRG